MSSAVRDLGELEPYLGRRAAPHLHFARLRAEAWRGHTDAVGALRQRAAGGAVVAGRERGDQGILRRQDLDRAARERPVGLRRADHGQDLAGGRRTLGACCSPPAPSSSPWGFLLYQNPRTGFFQPLAAPAGGVRARFGPLSHVVGSMSPPAVRSAQSLAVSSTSS